MIQPIRIPAESSEVRGERALRLAKFIASLDCTRAWEMVVRPYVRKRSGQQNAYLWSIYEYILEAGGEEMAGWDKNDLHTFFLGEHTGWETRNLFGKKRLVPLKRSTRMNKQEFTDFLEFIMRFMAERGVYIPSPDEDWSNAA